MTHFIHAFPRNNSPFPDFNSLLARPVKSSPMMPDHIAISVTTKSCRMLTFEWKLDLPVYEQHRAINCMKHWAHFCGSKLGPSLCLHKYSDLSDSEEAVPVSKTKSNSRTFTRAGTVRASKRPSCSTGSLFESWWAVLAV